MNDTPREVGFSPKDVDKSQVIDLKQMLALLEHQAAAGDKDAEKKAAIVREMLVSRKSEAPSEAHQLADLAAERQAKVEREAKEARIRENAIGEECKLALAANNSEQAAAYLNHWLVGQHFETVDELKAALELTPVFTTQGLALGSQSSGYDATKHEIVIQVLLRGEPQTVRIVTTKYQGRNSTSFGIDAIRIIANPEALKR